jgi:hypothetical protein
VQIVAAVRVKRLDLGPLVDQLIMDIPLSWHIP